MGRQCGPYGWPGEQVVVVAAAKRYIRAALKLAARGQFSKKEGEKGQGQWGVWDTYGPVCVCGGGCKFLCEDLYCW